MTRRWTRRALVVGALLLAMPAPHVSAACKSTCTEELRACGRACASSHGRERRQCRQRCGDQSTCTAPGVRARTFVWGENVCEETPDGAVTLSQKLVARHGNCDPVTLLALPPVGPIAGDPIGVCAIYGRFRAGAGATVAGLIQRITALPDGVGVLFEVTNDYAALPPLIPALALLSPEPPIAEGIYFVRTNGTGLRWLSPPMGSPIIVIGGLGFQQIDNLFLGVSPSGRLLAVTGMGPGPDGEPAQQVFLVTIATGERTQITHLPATEEGINGLLFADERTIFFYDNSKSEFFSVGTDGGDPVPPPSLVALRGARVVPRFAIASDGATFVGLPLDRTPNQTYPAGNGSGPVEVFRLEGSRLLQLTNFGYQNTLQIEPARDGTQFASSADPLGENPDGVCQLFSIDSLAGHLRQLTRFPYDGRPHNGCIQSDGGSCTINGDVWDPRTGMVGVISSCDALGRNPDGEQFFTMRPDGSRIRQITSFRGVEKFPDGSIRVELGGPYGYSAPLF